MTATKTRLAFTVKELRAKLLAIAAELECKYHDEMTQRHNADGEPASVANDGATLTAADGFHFCLTWSEYEQRLCVHLPVVVVRVDGEQFNLICHDVRAPKPDITVAITRSPKAIATDIVRRFVPAAKEAAAKIAEHAASIREHYTGRQRTRETIREMIAGAHDSNVHRSQLWAPEPYGTVIVHGENSVDLHFHSISKTLATDIIMAVELWREQNK